MYCRNSSLTKMRSRIQPEKISNISFQCLEFQHRDTLLLFVRKTIQVNLSGPDICLENKLEKIKGGLAKIDKYLQAKV